MAKIIVNCRYLKGAGKAKRSNLVQYMGTRPGVELNEQDAHRLNPATDKQKDLIAELEKAIPDIKTYFEYEDYIKNPTIENSSALITAAQDMNFDLFATKENLVEYMGKRPGAERSGEHGLFSGGGSADIRAAMNEVANHEGNIWTHVISLRREDAERLGYNNQQAWRDLSVSQMGAIAKNMKIPMNGLRWYAAFHNESHHPHMHMVVFAADAQSGYLSKKGIEKIKSGFAHEIFKLDFLQIYERKQLLDNDLTQYSRDKMQSLIDALNADQNPHPDLERRLLDLAADLQNHKGKKVYGFLKPDIKSKVDEIVRRLAADPRISELYKGWCECQNEIIRTYKFDIDDPPPLERQPEFRSIHNAVVRAAAELNIATITADPDGDFSFSSKQEREEKRHAPQEQERMEETVIHPSPAAQTQAPATPRPQEPGFADSAPVQAGPLLSSAALSVTRLLKSLGNNVHNSYQSGHGKLFAHADRRILQKQAQKKEAQGHQRDDREQEQTQY